MVNCPWPIDVKACCVDTGLDPENPDHAARIASVIARVSEMMSRWSGFTFGGCRTVRPLDPCGECRSGCCAAGDCIVLHDASAALAVRVRGEVIDPALWHFDAARGILCAVPPLRWPTADPRFESAGALEVDVAIGAAPDEWALSVAATLACELLASCAGQKCRLPRNATTVTTQGVTVTLSEDEIRYALPEVSAWVTTVNPSRATSPARVFSPEASAGRTSAPRMAGTYSRPAAPWGR